jgi:hypothetical protein
MTFKEVGTFDTDDQAKLARQLTAFEDNVRDEFVVSRKTFAQTPAVQTRISLPAPKPAAFALQPDEQASFDTALGNLTGVLPPLVPANFGRRFIVVKRLGTNTVNVVCQDASVKLNGGAFPLAITASGVTVFYCDAAGYYK